MKTLSEHNTQQMKRHDAMRKMQEPQPNGIACPNCKAELWDSNPLMILTSNPPQKNVHCPKCNYDGIGWHDEGNRQKVKFTGCNEEQKNMGNCDNPEGKLHIGSEYVISDVEEHSWHTKISLEGIDGSFNSVCFDEV